jgi:hypothetical protein
VTAEKVEVVNDNAETYGLNMTLEAIGLPKSTWYYWKNRKVDYEEKYRPLREPLIEVLTGNPGYGYRRVEPELKARGYRVGETVVQRVLDMWDLSLRRWVRKPKPSVPRKLLQTKGHGMNLVVGMDVVHRDLVRAGWEEGLPDAAAGSCNKVGRWLGARPPTEHGARTGGPLHGESGAC